MTTYIPFSPSQISVFSAQVTLDGQTYNLTTPWNVFGQRYYLNVSGFNGNLIFSLPLISSPTGVYIASISWNNGTVSVTTETPHNYPLGSSVELNIINCAPAAYNGTHICTITGVNSFNYMLAADPGVNTTLGAAQYNINLVGGYFTASTLVFRESPQQFEVMP